MGLFLHFSRTPTPRPLEGVVVAVRVPPPPPADDADVKLAIEDAGTDDPVAPDGGVGPALPGGAQDALAVQVGGDALRSLAGDGIVKLAESGLGRSRVGRVNGRNEDASSRLDLRRPSLPG